MSRNRLTRNSQTSQGRQASRSKFADPYTMNQERTHIPTETYMTGDPSEWAEDPVGVSDMDGTDRDEIGLPELDRTASARTAQLQRHFEKKALHCVRIAEVLLPGASEMKLSEQALDLMSLPDDAILATTNRLFASEEVDEEEEDGEEDAKEAKKKASLSPNEMLRRMLAAEDSDEEEEDEEDAEEEDEEDEEDTEEDAKEAKKKAKIAFHTAKLRALIAEDADEEGEDEEEDAKEAKKKANYDSMLDDLQDDMGDADDLMDDDLDMMLGEMDILGPDEDDYLELDPTMDELDSDMLMDESDTVLEALMMRSSGGKTASTKKKASKGIKALGRVKEAGAAADDLSKLWASAPNVSNVFGK